ncbi:MAG: hypothetical protein ABI741_13345 [Ferruginibacter sp.]
MKLLKVVVFTMGLMSPAISLCQNFLSTNNNNVLIASNNCGQVIDGSCICNNGSWPGSIGTPFQWTNYNEGRNIPYDHINYSRIFGLSGTVVDTSTAGTDFPLSHVFGYDPQNNNKLFKDWESFIVVDPPFTNLLTKDNNPSMVDKDGNPIKGEYQDAIRNALNFHGLETIGSGVMGLEFESGLIPDVYRSGIGDRIAVFGDLILDCGHDYHSEIHPPLMLVNAKGFDKVKFQNPFNQNQKIPTSIKDITFTTVISRPYHVNQLYNGGLTFLGATTEELLKATAVAQGAGWLFGFQAPLYHLTINPDILEKPFNGIQLMTFDVFPQKPNASGDVLWAEYHFTVRNGVTVSVVNFTDHIKVIVSMNDVVYNSSNKLLKKHERNIDENEFNAMGYGTWYTGAILSAKIIPGVSPILAQGIKTIAYESPNPSSNSDSNIFPSSSRPNTFCDISDEQPYPIYGWMTVGWKKRIIREFTGYISPCDRKYNPKTTLRPIIIEPKGGNSEFSAGETKTFVITNNNNEEVNIKKIMITGLASRFFKLLLSPTQKINGINIPANGTTSFDISYKSAAEGRLEAEIEILTNLFNTCPYKWPISAVQIR